MRTLLAALATAFALAIAGCSDEGPAQPQKPFALTMDAIGRYCGMNVLEHPGPKGQILLGKIPEPIWFSSARDAVAFTMLPEEPKNIAAIYVSDMAKAESWEKPGAENWVEARQAFYVIASAIRGGMGAPETVPFSTQAAAAEFAGKNGGQVVSFADIPPAYVLGPGEAPADDGMPPQTTGSLQ
ncbi:nitrous oxide reductase accessory protein NosL [Pseudaminobacter sp. 19-2017]|uniref:Nitrous oxide reductase accessory protein NosL n=1 Tax=Pseudaminobacter soli (ex Zhang et al. 2022) TaxID=2831468 RepID=A0A942E0Q8_9HYPH|nr:nitrous oxide reductase accessory protein NosL [Pseudaminobacter soli]MBS3651614.1 nitrous oxide reductase accessory protein NosL [Pseudaminobacter soli]